MQNQSSWLSGICACCIVLGALGMCTSVMGVVNVLFLGQIQNAFQSLQPPSTGPAQDAAKKMNDDMLEALDGMKGINLAVAAGNFLISTALLIGGIQTLRMRSWGRSLLVGTCLVAAVFDIGQLVAGVVQQKRVMVAQSDALEQAMQSQSGGQRMPGMGPAMSSMAKLGMIVGVVFAIGWYLAKLTAYIGTFIFLRRPAVRSLFAEEPIFASGPGNPTDDLAGIDDFDA